MPHTLLHEIIYHYILIHIKYIIYTFIWGINFQMVDYKWAKCLHMNGFCLTDNSDMYCMLTS